MIFNQPKAAAGVSAEPMISFPRWWIEQIRDGLMAMDKLPSGQLGDWAFLFREQLADMLLEREIESARTLPAAGVSKDTRMSTAKEMEPCPFCGSSNIDPAGWATLPQYAKTPEERSGPACDDCGASAESVERWNTRTLPSSDQCVAREAQQALTKIAAECHRSKWAFDDDKDKRPFDDLHRIGDLALKLRDALTVPQAAVAEETEKRFILTAEGEQLFPQTKVKRGVILGESRDKSRFSLRFDGTQSPVSLHKKFVILATTPPRSDVPAGVREALTLGRDAVMESFDHVGDKADQDIADMRLRSIDAALAAVTGDTILEESERLDGTIVQTVRLADGTEIVRPLKS